MDWILNISLQGRIAALFVIGCALGSLCNWAIYRMAYHQRSISPWSAPPAGAPPRRWFDRLPILGWWFLRRESALHGRAHGVRPLIVELLAGGLLAGFYWWEIGQRGLLPDLLQVAVPRWPIAEQVSLQFALHQQYLLHAILMVFMIVATFIDFDEQLIPDTITIPGTLLGLMLLVAMPSALLPQMQLVPIFGGGANKAEMDLVTILSPNDWPAQLDGAPNQQSLGLGLGCYWLWCLGLLDRRWRGRRGWRMAGRIMLARMRRDLMTRIVVVLAIVGASGIAWCWSIGGPSWRALLTGLVGMAVGGLLIWIVRIIGRFALRKEAMGFGDVTLMAMIGVVVGWQACLMIFFIAPLAGLALGLAQWFARRESELPYGPFLCIATLVVIWNWAGIWEWSRPFFGLPWLVPTTMALCMATMAVMLTGMRWVRERIGG